MFIFLASLRTHTYLERTDLLPCPSPISLLGSMVAMWYMITRMQGTFFTLQKENNKYNLSDHSYRCLKKAISKSLWSTRDFHELSTLYGFPYTVEEVLFLENYPYQYRLLWHSAYLHSQPWATLAAHLAAIFCPFTLGSSSKRQLLKRKHRSVVYYQTFSLTVREPVYQQETFSIFPPGDRKQPGRQVRPYTFHVSLSMFSCRVCFLKF